MRNWIERAVRWAWHQRWLIVMNAYLVSPVLLYEFRIGEGGPDKTILFLLSASVLWLVAAQLLARRVWIAHALMFPLYLVVAVDLYVITHYHTRLSSSMLLTIFENLEDGREYIETNYKGMVGTLASRDTRIAWRRSAISGQALRASLRCYRWQRSPGSISRSITCSGCGCGSSPTTATVPLASSHKRIPPARFTVKR